MQKHMYIISNIKKILITISKLFIFLCSIMMFIMMILISLEVLLRYIFTTSLIWPFEIVEFMLVAITFLGLAYLELTEQNLKVDFFFNLFPKYMKSISNIVGTLTVLIFSILTTIIGGTFAWLAWSENIRSWTVMRIAMWPVRLTIPLGGFLLCSVLLLKLFDSFDIFIKNRSSKFDHDGKTTH